jgi:hypothetical protein
MRSGRTRDRCWRPADSPEGTMSAQTNSSRGDAIRRRDLTRSLAMPAGQASESATRTMLTLLLILVIGIVLAAAIMFSDASRVFLLKFTAAAILSAIPGWLYLQFIRNKGPSLYDEYVLNLFRLEIDSPGNLPAPPEHTSWYQKWKEAHDSVVRGQDIRDNLYRRKFEALYGPASVSTIGLIKRGDRLSWRERTETVGPVVMATIVVALGWALVLQPELLRSINLLGAGRELSGRPILPAEPLQLAFIGAYAFIILDLGRRYFRDDLKSAAYLSATTRIVFASALVVAADAAGWAALLSPAQINAAAFFVGFFPRAGFTWLRALLPARLQAAIPQLESDYPLRDLEGLNIWYESRLIEEGVESMQNLCSASLVDLMLKTRLPIMRVVDWLDQAYLYLHLPKDKRREPPPNLHQLRILGIRTATDLERVWKQPDRPPELELLLGAAVLPNDPDKGRAVITSILLSLDAEPNLWHVRAFRKLQWLRDDPRASSQQPAPGTQQPGNGSLDHPHVVAEVAPQNGRHRAWRRKKPISG